MKLQYNLNALHEILIAIAIAIIVGTFFGMISDANAGEPGSEHFQDIEMYQELLASDARAAQPTYQTEGLNMKNLTTRTMDVPSGYHVVRVQHPPRLDCTTIPIPDTFQMVLINKAPAVRRVTIEQEDLIRQALGDE